MTLREYYLERRRAEVPIFLRILRALPDDRVVSRKSICMDLQGIVDRACTASDPVIMLGSS